MNNRLLTLDDLVEFYSSKKKSMRFSAEKNGEPITIQVEGKLSFSKSNDKFKNGLTPVRLQACHTEKNLNASSVSYETMKDKLLPSFKNRPILGYIHTVDGIPQFYGHNAHEEDGEIVYDEIAVGNIPETNNAELVYDEENDRYNVFIDGYLYDEYTKATEIVQREGECPCSVEISVESMFWDNNKKTLVIDDGYFSGVAILGYDESGNKVQPGMAGSNIKLKDFSKSNNSILNDFSEIEQSKLIETLDKLNETLTTISNFNINPQSQLDNEQEKGGNDKVMFESLLEKYNKTVEDITFDYESMSDEELEVKFSELFDEDIDDDINDPEDTTGTGDDSTDTDDNSDDDSETNDEANDDTTVKEDNSCNDDDKDKENNLLNDTTTFTKTFSVSHEDLRSILYTLLAPLEETLNDCYWIVSTYDNYFVYQSYLGNYFKQKFTVDNDNVAFDGEREEVFAEFVNTSEKEELDSMRSNYSAISEKLAKYEEAEELDDKMTVFSDDAYAEYLETEEFKSLMTKETLKQFTKDELVEKADAALGKLNRTTKTFAKTDDVPVEKPKAQSFFAFSRNEQTTSFLDGLLKK